MRNIWSGPPTSVTSGRGVEGVFSHGDINTLASLLDRDTTELGPLGSHPWGGD